MMNVEIPNEQRTLVEVYPAHTQAESAVKELQKSGFDMKKLSIVAKDFANEEKVVGYYNAGDRVKYWGKYGAIWGGVWTLLFGTGLFLIPGLGPIVVGGHVLTALVGVLEGAAIVGGFSAIGAALYSVGIPKDSVLKYELEIKAGKFLVLAHGTNTEIERAREILANSGVSNAQIHAA